MDSGTSDNWIVLICDQVWSHRDPESPLGFVLVPDVALVFMESSGSPVFPLEAVS